MRAEVLERLLRSLTLGAVVLDELGNLRQPHSWICEKWNHQVELRPASVVRRALEEDKRCPRCGTGYRESAVERHIFSFCDGQSVDRLA